MGVLGEEFTYENGLVIFGASAWFALEEDDEWGGGLVGVMGGSRQK